MSLINQMLQDLETRRAVGEQAAFPNYVRPLPTSKSSAAPKILVVGIVIAALAGGVMWWIQSRFGVPKSADSFPASVTTTPPLAKVRQPQDNASVHAPLPAQTVHRSGPPPAAHVVETDVTSAPPPQSTAASPAGSSESTARAPAFVASAPVPTDRVRRAPDYRLTVDPMLSQPLKPRKRESVPVSSAVAAPSAVAPPKANTGPVVIEKQVRLASTNERAESEYRKALVMLNQGRISEAILGLRAALREDATHQNARSALAGILIEQRQLEDAQLVLQEGLVQNPAQVDAAIKLARIQVERGDMRAASETLNKSAASGAGNADYRAFNAGVLQRLGEHAAAVQEYQAALRLAPQSNVWWMGLGISLEAEGRMVEARDAFQKARAGGNLSADLDRFVEQKLRQLQ